MRKYISEFLGTFLLVFIGCGGVITANSLITAMGMPYPLGFTTVTIALVFGLITGVLYYVFREVSGGHLNPAISLAVLIDGGFNKLTDFLFYIVAQFAGGAAGAGLLWIVTGQRTSLGQNGYEELSALYSTLPSAIIIEIVLTMILTLVFLKVSKNSNSTFSGAGIIGIAAVALYIIGLPFTGGAMNPARSFGPAVFVLGDAIKQLPIFIVAPLVGATFAAVIYKLVIEGKTITIKKNKTEEKSDEKVIDDTVSSSSM